MRRPTPTRTPAGSPSEPERHGPAAPTSARAPSPEDASRRARLGAGLLFCLKVFLAVRIGLTIVALLAVALLPSLTAAQGERFGIPGPVGVPGWPAHTITPGWHNLFTAWERFDALWFLRIADGGYANGDGSAAFFPLYPILVRGVSFVLGGHPLAAAILVSNAAFIGALMMLYVLTRTELSERLARHAVVFTAVFPTAFFFLAPYSESTFLLLVLVAFWGARRARWEVAGVAAMLAALTRNLGVLLILPLLVEAVHQAVQARPRRIPLRALVWSGAPALGALSYLWFWQRLSGDWLAPLHQQANWQRELTTPLATAAAGTSEAFRWIGQYPGGYHLLDWLVAVPVVVAALYAAWRFRPAYGVYVWTNVLVPLSFVFAARPLMSFPRFALALFPVSWALASWTERREGLRHLVVAASAMLLGIMTLLFAAWFYVF